MSDQPTHENHLSKEALAYYDLGQEQARLSRGAGQLELARTQELLTHYLPPPPAVIYDIGGGAGVYALWLARLGYEVHLVDAVPLHVEQARQAALAQPDHPLANLTVGDARRLDRADASVDAALLLGPLYHLTEREDRVTALREAGRILRPGSRVFAVGISRFASTLDGLVGGELDDPEFYRIVQRDLIDGQHRNPTNHPAYFTTAFFHHPDELKAEVEAADLQHEATLGIEGPGWLLQDFETRWANPTWRARLMEVARWLEAEPTLLGIGPHIMVVARKS